MHFHTHHFKQLCALYGTTIESVVAELLDGRLGIAGAGWLAIFGFGLLATGSATGWFAWRRFRRRFIGLQQTREELREDLAWLKGKDEE